MFKVIIKTFFTVLIIAGIVFLAAYKSYEFGQKLGGHAGNNIAETR
jgi:hypothetical protein